MALDTAYEQAGRVRRSDAKFCPAVNGTQSCKDAHWNALLGKGLPVGDITATGRVERAEMWSSPPLSGLDRTAEDGSTLVFEPSTLVGAGQWASANPFQRDRNVPPPGEIRRRVRRLQREARRKRAGMLDLHLSNAEVAELRRSPQWANLLRTPKALAAERLAAAYQADALGGQR